VHVTDTHENDLPEEGEHRHVSLTPAQTVDRLL